MENSFKSITDQSKSILVLLPTKPYFDQVAAGLALYLSLRQEKDVQIISPSPMTVEFNRIVGVNRISQDMGNKNLIIRFSDYKADDIERVSYDIENGQFRLTVIPRQKVSPPGKDQVELTYSGISADTVIMVGGANDSHFPAISSKELSGANMVHVGTRDLTLSSNKTYVSFSRPASSVSEVVASLIKEAGMTIDEDIATDLLMGIESASDNLTDPSVSADTFAVVAELMKMGGKRTTSQPTAKRDDYPQGAIPGQFQQRQPLNRMTRQDTNQPRMQGQDSYQSGIQDQQQRPTIQTQNQNNNSTNDDTFNEEEAPKDWLQPKIYKGTSIS